MKSSTLRTGFLGLLGAAFTVLRPSCSGQTNGLADDAGVVDVHVIDTDAMPPAGSFCSQPGSVVWTSQGPMLVPGGPEAAPDLGWLQLATGDLVQLGRLPAVLPCRSDGLVHGHVSRNG